MAADRSPNLRRTAGPSGITATDVLFILLGVVMVVAGSVSTAVSIVGEVDTVQQFVGAAIGTVLTGAGGVAISWVGASTYARKTARSEMESHIDSVSQNLTLAASQMDAVIRQVHQGDTSADVGLVLVDQAMVLVTGQIKQLQVLVGKPLDTQDWLETRNTVRGLALEVADIAASDGPASREELKKIATQLEAVRKAFESRPPSPPVRTPKLPPRLRDEAIACPECGWLAEVRLPERDGETRLVVCGDCNAAFNVHRAGGLAVAKLANSSQHPDLPSAEFDCDCGNSLSIRKTNVPGVPRGGGLSGPRRRDRDGVSHRAMVSENDQELTQKDDTARWLLTSLPSSSCSGN